jgi:hypothetical protein
MSLFASLARTARFCLIGIALMFSVSAGRGQTPPPNDNFTNRILVSGSSLTITGTLAGATIENGEPTDGPTSGSVWWTWTAPVSGVVVIQMIRDYSQANSANTSFAVFTGNDLNSLTYIDGNSFDAPIGRYAAFTAAAGTAYQFRVAGGLAGSFSLKLTSSNTPVFLIQPADCAVSPHGSAFFSAFAGGLSSGDSFHPSVSYQWKSNGVAIAGQTSPSLLVHDVGTNQVGNYSVIASNANGAVESAPAVLTLTDTNPVPRLEARIPSGAGLFSFSLTGEGGRWYRIESSTNVNGWSAYNWDWSTSVWVQSSNSTTFLSVPRLGPNHFVRASLDVLTDVCIGQLRQMRAAQYIVAIEKRESMSSLIFLEDIKPYVPIGPFGNITTCPEYGTYSAPQSILQPITCSVQSHGHKLTGP